LTLTLTGAAAECKPAADGALHTGNHNTMSAPVKKPESQVGSKRRAKAADRRGRSAEARAAALAERERVNK
jgi:hypothetical protein